ncbi:eukaryotic translation initiation factor 4B-like isoform X2 [Belonocnema kinseyi]|uniref:eukaryotic translation initiation factor 4B-like isoform X2 n=1 Tax=Belonocnema kinseyi TaxID=2817044 RepID=UPI00143D1D13|nr:eukaryotic translation initiation factor 4B-like isoform X2 [Belonocnema kinseyi]
MSSGKKGKKSKGKTVALHDFLADTPGGLPSIPLKSTNWADDIEEEHDGYMSRSSKEPVVLPTAPRAAREPGFNEENIPTHPPFVAYVSNLPYDIAEEDLADFFEGMNISSMRLPKELNKLRGYGYVEFEDRQSLIDALAMTDATLQSRRIRIEVSNSSNDERRGGRMGRDNRRDGGFEDSEQRTSGDWRSGPRDDGPSDGDRYRNRGGFENRDRDRDRKEEKEETDNTPGAWRSGGDRERPAFREKVGDDREKDWGSSRYGGDRGSRDRDGDRDRDRSGSGFGPRRNYGGDSNWDRERTHTKPSASDSEPSELRTRPKLQLQPRTKPVEQIIVKEEVSEEAPVAAAPEPAATIPVQVSAVNIFGSAKPVDTSAREREIEERLNKTYADSKAKEEPESEKRTAKEGTAWGRRNGDGREEKEKSKPTWRSEDDRGRPSERPERRIEKNNPPPRSEQRGDSRGSPTSRGCHPLTRASKQAEAGGSPPERYEGLPLTRIDSST